MGLTAAEQLLADVALGAAIGACTTTLLSCPLVVAAMAAVATTSARYLMAVIAYDECMHPPAVQTRPSGGSGPAYEGDGGGGYECHYESWEISYDGGATWQPYGQVRVCGENAE